MEEAKPISDTEEEMREILIMMNSGRIDYSSFEAETVERLLQDYYYQDNEDGIERSLYKAAFIVERFKAIPPRRYEDVFFL
ncbi:MAG: hypothetical protein K6T65_06965 [Peptococcaceae bacterium]|nr:hypothetical protein [Peptococcaceae bacterium]